MAVEVVEPQTPEHPRLPHAVPPAEALLLPLLEDVTRHADACEAREAVARHLARRHHANVAPQPLHHEAAHPQVLELGWLGAARIVGALTQ